MNEGKGLMPKLVSCLKGYDGKQFAQDAISGVIVAIIALPLSIALALASGVGPEQGIYTAIIAGFLISMFGGSKVQIAGPTAAFATIVAGIVAKSGMDGLIVASIIAGIFLILMGIFRLGTLIKFIPFTITTGFTAGIAVTILIGQLKDFFGLTYAKGTPNVETIDKVKAIAANFHTINVQALIVGVICLAILIVWPKVSEKIPGSLIAVIVGILLVKVFHMKVNTIGDLYTISSSLPKLHLPALSYSIVRDGISDGFTIAILAAIESLLSCVVADGMINDKHDSNMELVAQGIGNIGSVLFGGIPATGAIARTAANIKNGGRTPVAGMVHSVVLLLVLVLLMPYAAWIPMPTIAAILFLVAYNMSGWRNVVKLLKKAPKSDIIVLTGTFVLTVVFDLVIAIEAGMVAACILFMKRMSEESEVRSWTYQDSSKAVIDSQEHIDVPLGVRVYEINGPMFFGISDLIQEISLKDYTQVLILRMRGVNAVDASAMYALEQLLAKCKENNVTMILSHVNEQPYKVMKHGEFVKAVGKENFCKDIFASLDRAEEILQENAE